MRTNPHSRHGKCGRLRFSGILDARAKADDARQLQEMRRKIGLPAGFRSVQTLGAPDECFEDDDFNDDYDDDAYDHDIYDFDAAALDLDEVDPSAG
jgi:hypothetical protein